MNCSTIESLSDHERVFVHGATVSSLGPLIDPEVPWVWILDHRPNIYLEWWNTVVALNRRGATFAGLVRNLVYDLQLSTSMFLSRIAEFDDDGIELIQSHKQMPATLQPNHVPKSRARRILVDNGATLRIWLPHAIETAMIESFVPGYLARALDK